MRSKHIMLMIVAALMLGLLAAPASANKVKDKDGQAGGLKDSGVLSGTATVGKFRDQCLHDGTSNVFGPGLGTPDQARKNGYFALSAAITSAFKPTSAGTLKVCGRLTKMHSAVNGGMGAACGASKGWDGKGTVQFPGKPTVWLKNLGWKVSVGGTLPVTGEANQAPNETASKAKTKPDFITATVQAQGANACLTKVDGSPKTGGATAFAVAGNYEIANKTGPLDGNQNVGPECKEGMANGCLNDPKKRGANG